MVGSGHKPLLRYCPITRSLLYCRSSEIPAEGSPGASPCTPASEAVRVHYGIREVGEPTQISRADSGCGGASDGLCVCDGADDAEPGLQGRHALQPARDVVHGRGHRRAEVVAARLRPGELDHAGRGRRLSYPGGGARVRPGCGGLTPHGSSTWVAALAIIGRLIGGIVGRGLPVPIVGTLLGDLWAGRPLFPSFEAGWGAAVGRFWGTASKLAIGGIIPIILALVAFF